MKKRRIISALILISIILSMFSPIVICATHTIDQNVKITLISGTTSVTAGNTVVVQMNIQCNGQAVDTISGLEIKYDNTVLSLNEEDDVATGASKFSYTDYSTSTGVLAIETNRSSANSLKDGIMYTFTFRALQTVESTEVTVGDENNEINCAYLGDDIWVQGSTVTIPKPVTKYNVTYHDNKPTGVTETVSEMPSTNPVQVNEGASHTTVALPTLTGYVCTGWYDAASGGTKVTSLSNINANKDLYAQWRKSKSSLTINPDGGSYSGQTSYANQDYGTEVTVGTPGNKTYTLTFRGDTGASIDGGASQTTDTVTLPFKEWVKTGSGNGTLDATSNKFTFGTKDGGSNTLTATYTPQTITLPGVTCPHKVFKFWSITQGGGSIGGAGDTYTPIGNTTFYAKWDEETKYTITYDYKGGTAPTTANPTQFYMSDSISITNQPIREGYDFTGWKLTGGYTTTEMSVTIPSNGATGNVTATAQWSAHTYTVKYDANGGTGTTADSIHTYGTESSLTANGFTRNGYTFAGWAATPTGTVQYSNLSNVSTLTATDGGEVTLYAVWTENGYTVTYNENGGSGAPANQTKIHETNLTLSDTEPTRKGYSFNGWNTEADGSGVDYAKGSSYTTDSDVTLYAQWDINTYTITYEDTYDSTNTNVTSYNVENENIVLTELTRDGYNFKGWYTTRNYTDKVDTINVSQAKNITLYAWWEQKPQVVKPEIQMAYYVKVLLRDETTEENTFEYFNDSRIYADMHKDENVKVFDAKGHIVYDPNEKIEDLYLKTNYYKIGETHTSVYEEQDMYIAQIGEKTTLAALKTKLNTNGKIEVFKTNGDVLENNEYVGTGMILKDSKYGQSITLTIIVMGDLNGDGECTIKDLTILNNKLLGRVELQDAVFMAADLKCDNKLSITDLSILNKILLGLIIF